MTCCVKYKQTSGSILKEIFTYDLHERIPCLIFAQITIIYNHSALCKSIMILCVFGKWHEIIQTPNYNKSFLNASIFELNVKCRLKNANQITYNIKLILGVYGVYVGYGKDRYPFVNINLINAVVNDRNYYFSTKNLKANIQQGKATSTEIHKIYVIC